MIWGYPYFRKHPYGHLILGFWEPPLPPQPSSTWPKQRCFKEVSTCESSLTISRRKELCRKCHSSWTNCAYETSWILLVDSKTIWDVYMWATKINIWYNYIQRHAFGLLVGSSGCFFFSTGWFHMFFSNSKCDLIPYDLNNPFFVETLLNHQVNLHHKTQAGCRGH